MITAEYNKAEGKIIIKSDDITTKALLEYRRQETQWNPWLKSWRTEEVIDKLYDNPRTIGPRNGIWTFKLGPGWAAFCAQLFKQDMDPDSYKNLTRSILSDTYRTIPFPGLRDYQNDDVLHILKYKRALCSVNTGYGKTQVIATLANYFYKELGKKVLLVCPNTKPKDELISRYKKLFQEDLPDGWNGDLGIVMVQGLMSKKIIKDPNQRKLEEQKLLKYDVVMVDEVEYTVGGKAGPWLFDHLLGAERFYGFSGSADRYNGNCISFAEGITSTVIQNKDLIKYFGPSLVHRMPVSNTINNIAIKTQALNDIEFGEDDITEDDNVYNTIMNTIWTDPGVCEVICKVIEKYPKLYIPINNLEKIIKNWIENYWKGRFKILAISHEGYIYYDLKGNVEKLTLEEAGEKMKNNEVDVIPSTSSGFRALDFPGLSNILMVAGKNAGIVLQTLGRTARVQEMNVLHLEPKKFRWLPVYTKGMKHRDEMLKNYYKYCQINDIKINEEDF